MTRADRVLSTPPTSTPIDSRRRRFLSVAAGGAVAAAIPTTVAKAGASAVDPIFAAIDEHRNAYAAHLASIDELARLEKIHGLDAADGSITEKPCHDENDAFEALVAAAATTFPGLHSKLAYLRQIAEQHEPPMRRRSLGKRQPNPKICRSLRLKKPASGPRRRLRKCSRKVDTW
jgi:hypothetical protein